MILWEKHVLNDVQFEEFDLIFCETGSKKSTRMIVWCLTPPGLWCSNLAQQSVTVQFGSLLLPW